MTTYKKAKDTVGFFSLLSCASTVEQVLGICFKTSVNQGGLSPSKLRWGTSFAAGAQAWSAQQTQSTGGGWTDETSRPRWDMRWNTSPWLQEPQGCSLWPLPRSSEGRRFDLLLPGKCLFHQINDRLGTKSHLWLPIPDFVAKLWWHKGQKMQLFFSALLFSLRDVRVQPLSFPHT